MYENKQVEIKYYNLNSNKNNLLYWQDITMILNRIIKSFQPKYNMENKNLHSVE
jgi:hypothetical protein